MRGGDTTLRQQLVEHPRHGLLAIAIDPLIKGLQRDTHTFSQKN